MTTSRDSIDDDLELFEPLDDRPGPAKRISSQHAAELVGAVLDRAAEDRATTAGTRSSRSVRRVVLVAAALVVVAGAASAAIYELSVRRSDSGPSTPAPRHRVAPSATREEPEPEPTVEPVDETPAEPEPAVVDPVERSRPARKRAPARTDVDESPEDLLAQANERRKESAWRQAAKLYQRVRDEYPGTSAAYVATLASASIHLEHLDGARRALELYRAAMRDRPEGYLAEEARYGLAEAYRALGQPKAEARALSEFLDKHPGSPLRERAERRLDQLRPGSDAPLDEGPDR